MRIRVVLGVATIGAFLGFVTRPAAGRTLDGCRPLRAIFYAATGSLPLAQGLAANASPCAQYLISVPPLASDKTQMRSGVAGPIRALGPNFHALAEVNVTAWQNWVASTGNTWYQAGVEARNRMAAAGFDVSAGDSWAINELSSAVRVGSGASRQNLRDLVHGLSDGASGPSVKGVAFTAGIGQPTASLDVYKARLESWLEDAAFWSDMNAYVSDFLQENYGDVRDYGVAGADVPTRLGYLNQYLQHVLQVALVAPAPVAVAQAYLQGSYAPLANAAWAWSSGFGYTAVPVDQMEDFVSAQVDAMRSFDAALGWSGDRLGFAWSPSNTLGLSASDFTAQVSALTARLGAAIAASADPSAPGAGACAPPWCTATVADAAFTGAWSTFATWTPASAGFVSAPQTVTAGSATGPMSIQLQIGTTAVTVPIDTSVVLSSSSPGGSFSTNAAGPWTPTLALTIPAGSPGTTFYMLDTQAGTPTVTATANGVATTQLEVVNAPAAPLALGAGGNTVTYIQGGSPVAVDPALTVTDSQSPTLSSATVAISSGLDPADVLTAATAGTVIAASYAAGTLTLSGTDSLANYQTVLRTVTFSGSTTNGGTRTILWTAGDGTTAASAVSTVVYTAPPSAPTGVAAAADDGQATVTFDAPGSNGGTQVTSYTVTASPGGQTAGGGGSPITVSGLADGTTYTFTVTATNAAGTGPASTGSNAVTPLAPAVPSPSPGGSPGGSTGGSTGGGGGGGGGAATTTTTTTTTTTSTTTTTTAPATTTPAPLQPPISKPTPPRPPKAVGPKLTVSVLPLLPIRLGLVPPTLSVIVHPSAATELELVLHDPKGRVLASWRKHVIRGAHRLSFVLLPKARVTGKDQLTVTWPGGKAKLPVAVLPARAAKR